MELIETMWNRAERMLLLSIVCAATFRHAGMQTVGSNYRRGLANEGVWGAYGSSPGYDISQPSTSTFWWPPWKLMPSAHVPQEISPRTVMLRLPVARAEPHGTVRGNQACAWLKE